MIRLLRESLIDAPSRCRGCDSLCPVDFHVLGNISTRSFVQTGNNVMIGVAVSVNNDDVSPVGIHALRRSANSSLLC
jgi:hypothetical protein